MYRMLRADGLLAPAALLGGLVIAACGVILEAVMYRALLDLASTIGLPQHRLAVLGMLLGFAVVLLVVGTVGTMETLRFGRNLEMRLRMLLLERIPLLPDRYFASRPVSDMAQRSHALHQIRGLPGLGARLLAHTFELTLTAAGIAFLDPHIAPLAAAAAVFAIALPLATQPILSERDLRLRTHGGALCNSYFDALCGLMPIRAHGAESAVRSEHEGLLVSWTKAGLRLQKGIVFLDAVGLCAGIGMTIWILLNHISRHPDSSAGLLLVYWALNLPVAGRELAQTIWQYPQQRNLALRLFEPLGGTAVPAQSPPASLEGAVPNRKGVEIVYDDVCVRALGQTILDDINLRIERGSQVCIVGTSGAGKSSLVGLLLGWHAPARGSVCVDGKPLGESEIENLRRQTAWVDPSIQIWNRSLLDNLRYGTTAKDDSAHVGEVIYAADLLQVLESLPDGLETPLGESGCLISGGEGQRVRLGRAMLRPDARFVILDEPFTALDRQQRQKMLARVRRIWAEVTMIFITHDIGESVAFERVLVLENGRIVEDGSPAELSGKVDSRYRQLLEAEENLKSQIWRDPGWRRISLDNGKLREDVVRNDNEQRPASKKMLAG
jgi:ATP-binding cassette subfamily B protein